MWSILKRLRPSRAACLVAAACGLFVGAVGCQEPVEPGSDLPDQAPPPNLGPNIDVGFIGDIEAAPGADVTGRFTLTAEARSQMGGQTVPFAFVAIFDQSGTIDMGDATVAVELRDPNAPDMSGPASMPVSVSATGSFEAAIEGYTVDAESSQFLTSDAQADVTLDGQIVNDDCVIGDATVFFEEAEVQGAPRPIEDLTLEGPFTADRQDTAGCGSDGTGGDADTGGG
jgi:hypothetical protein